MAAGQTRVAAMIVDPNRLYTRAETAAILGLKRPATLSDWACAGYGPPSLRVRGRMLFRGDDLLLWLLERPRAKPGLRGGRKGVKN